MDILLLFNTMRFITSTTFFSTFQKKNKELKCSTTYYLFTFAS